MHCEGSRSPQGDCRARCVPGPVQRSALRWCPGGIDAAVYGKASCTAQHTASASAVVHPPASGASAPALTNRDVSAVPFRSSPADSARARSASLVAAPPTAPSVAAAPAALSASEPPPARRCAAGACPPCNCGSCSTRARCSTVSRGCAPGAACCAVPRCGAGAASAAAVWCRTAAFARTSAARMVPTRFRKKAAPSPP